MNELHRSEPTISGPHSRAKIWLKRARADHLAMGKLIGTLNHKSRRRPSDAALAVYMLQQSVEKAAKALLVATGESESSIRRIHGHRSLAIFLDYLRRKYNIGGGGATAALPSAESFGGLGGGGGGALFT